MKTVNFTDFQRLVPKNLGSEELGSFSLQLRVREILILLLKRNPTI